MNQFKKQIVGVVSAMVLTVIAILGFKLIAFFYSSGFGKIAKEVTQLAISKHFAKIVIVLIISTIVLCAAGFAKTKLIKPLYIIWGILICVVCFSVCMRTGKYLFIDDTPEIKAMAVSATRLFVFVFGLAFPLLHLILSIQACGDSLKDNVINQVITMVLFLLLFAILTFIIGVLTIGLHQGITIAACLSSVVIIFPALNMNSIRQQLKDYQH